MVGMLITGQAMDMEKVAKIYWKSLYLLQNFDMILKVFQKHKVLTKTQVGGDYK